MSYINNKDKDRNYQGFDLSVSRVQSAIAAKFKDFKVYHRAYLFREKNGNNKTLKIPKVWEDNNEYLNVLPNDFKQGMMFFYPTSDERVKEFDQEQSQNNIYERDVCCILWVNTKKLADHTTGPSLSAVKATILSSLSNSDYVVRVNSVCDNDAEMIYKEFTINDVKTQYLMLPYAGLRIDFTVKYNYLSC